MLQDSREKQGRLNQEMVFGHGVKPSVHVIRLQQEINMIRMTIGNVSGKVVLPFSSY